LIFGSEGEEGNGDLKSATHVLRAERIFVVVENTNWHNTN